ncbi:hypothetical protein SKAU_G00334920 [Synaphobranchus kaupii]|uniref:Uncharacterized protein n=1 Tax=Synaphobranchus kaupii TaxID=118154 RepID=A0A9Q1ELT6_SYNKA|nr:hypothetical protein SKAU_G00334920 [Synaphobranchus kaupii]
MSGVLHLQENNIQTISRAALAQLSKLEELHLDDNSISTRSDWPAGWTLKGAALLERRNRIAVIAEEAFKNVTDLERLVLDGNLLTDEGIAPGTFQDLVNLRELSMARNLPHRSSPPNLPAEFLV